MQIPVTSASDSTAAGRRPQLQLFTRARLLTMSAASGAGSAINVDAADSVAAAGERIVAIGSGAELRRRFPEAQVHDLQGRLVTPGLIDCHTHIVHGGDRSAEIDRKSVV